MSLKPIYHVIGVMSGTSLDGLDLVKCIFKKQSKWSFVIEKTSTIQYNKNWRKILKGVHLKNEKDIKKIDVKYGELIAKEIILKSLLTRHAPNDLAL